VNVAPPSGLLEARICPTVCLKNRTGNSQPHPHAGTTYRKERFKESRKIGLADTGVESFSHDNIAFRVNAGLDYEFALAVDARHRLQAVDD